MFPVSRFGWSFVCLCGPFMLIAASGGCSKQSSEPEVLTLKGKIESIERTSDQTGTITVRYYNENQKQEVLGTGRVTEETEVLIDGVAGSFADLREGDQVRGEVRVEKKGKRRIQTAIRIRVERPRPVGGD